MISVTKKTKRQYNTKLLDWQKNNRLDAASINVALELYIKSAIDYSQMKDTVNRLIKSYEEMLTKAEAMYAEVEAFYNKSRGI